MSEYNPAKPEIASQKRQIKLPPAIGDWTVYKPSKITIKKVKSGLYGFDRLSKQELNTGLIIHYNFFQKLFAQWKIDLKLAIEFISCQVEQTTFLGFLRTFPGPAVQAKLTWPDSHEEIQFFVELPLANTLINHVLGSRDLEPLNRGLTEAENTVITTALQQYLPLYAAAFKDIFPAPELTILGSPDIIYDQAYNTAATYVAFSADLAINDNQSGKIIFGFQGNTIKNLLKKFVAATATQPLDFNRLPSSLLSKLVVSATALLGRTTLTTAQLKQLEIGDVVSLDTAIDAPVTLNLSSFLKLPAQPGNSNKKLVVRLAAPGEAAIVTPPPLVSTSVAPAKNPAVIEKDLTPSKPQPAPLVEEEFEENEDILDEDFDEDLFLEEENLKEA